MMHSAGDRKTGIGAAILALVLGLGANAVCAAVLKVETGGSIAASIRAASPGDTVEIAQGDYAERLVIDKPLTLRGVGRPTIHGGFSGDVIRVRASDVTIQGLIVRDSGIDQTAQNSGIYFQPGAHRPTVQDCDVVYNLFGIWVEKADDARIQRNTIIGRRDLQ